MRCLTDGTTFERKFLLADAYIGAPHRLCCQPELCSLHRWNTSVDEFDLRAKIEILEFIENTVFRLKKVVEGVHVHFYAFNHTVLTKSSA
jgi:hypothetical protein